MARIGAACKLLSSFSRNSFLVSLVPLRTSCMTAIAAKNQGWGRRKWRNLSTRTSRLSISLGLIVCEARCWQRESEVCPSNRSIVVIRWNSARSVKRGGKFSMKNPCDFPEIFSGVSFARKRAIACGITRVLGQILSTTIKITRAGLLLLPDVLRMIWA